MLTENLGHQFVGEELASLHDLIGNLADVGPGLDCGPQNIAGRQLDHATLGNEPRCLRTFACPRGAKQDDIHAIALPF